MAKLYFNQKDLVIAFEIVHVITETRPFKNVDRENANKRKMT